MRKYFLFLIGCIFMILILVLVLNGCGGESGSGSGSVESYCGGGLFCRQINLCCPSGYPYYCDGQCLSSPRSGCNKSDTCTAG